MSLIQEIQVDALLETPPSPHEIGLLNASRRVLAALGHVLARDAANDPVLAALKDLEVYVETYPRCRNGAK